MIDAVNSSLLLKVSSSPHGKERQASLARTHDLLEDIVEISTTTGLTDNSPSLEKKKSFKSTKELVAYMMLLIKKYTALKPPLGQSEIKLEDQQELNALRTDLDELSTSKFI